jgi:hypothetical protein
MRHKLGRHTLLASLAMVVAFLVLVASALGGDTKPITGKIVGHFASASSCLGCGDLVRYVKADNVWCAWQGDNVIIHVRFRNSSIEHLTIHWHPSYVVRGGGAHGEGLSSMQDSGVNAHTSRGVFVKQKPKGVPASSRLSECKPSFSSVESG